MTDLSPQPIARQLCLVCGQLWVLHLQLAAWRYNATLDPDDERDFQYLTAENKTALVTLYDCIQLLKDANVGPMGLPGPQGAMGPAGRNA